MSPLLGEIHVTPAWWDSCHPCLVRLMSPLLGKTHLSPLLDETHTSSLLGKTHVTPAGWDSFHEADRSPWPPYTMQETRDPPVCLRIFCLVRFMSPCPVTHVTCRSYVTRLMLLMSPLLGETHVTPAGQDLCDQAVRSPHTPCRKQGTHLCLEDFLLGETHVTSQFTHGDAQRLQAATKVPHHLCRQCLHRGHVHNLKQAAEKAWNCLLTLQLKPSQTASPVKLYRINYMHHHWYLLQNRPLVLLTLTPLFPIHLLPQPPQLHFMNWAGKKTM